MEMPTARVGSRPGAARPGDERDRRLRRPGRRPRPHPARSGVGAVVDVDALPRSGVLAAQPLALQRECLLAGGDDYELVFSAPVDAARGGRRRRQRRRRRGDADRRDRSRHRRFVSSTAAAPRSPATRARSITFAPDDGAVRHVSSDPALNPPLAGAGRKPDWRFLLSHPAHLVALGFGSGLSPVAPGTAGTLWAWLVYALLPPLADGVLAAGLVAATLIGWWACTVTARDLAQADPSSVVWDEIVAFWLVLWLVTPATSDGAGDRVRPVPRLRRRQAGPGRVGRPALQASSRRADRLGAGLRHPARRLRRRALHPARDRPLEVRMSAPIDVAALVVRLADALRARRAMLATAESCTGGMVAAACTSLAGSSDWFERGFVTYSNGAKSEMLGVDPALIAAARRGQRASRAGDGRGAAGARAGSVRGRRDRHRRPGRRQRRQAGRHGLDRDRGARRRGRGDVVAGERRSRRDPPAVARARARAGARASRGDAARLAPRRSAPGARSAASRRVRSARRAAAPGASAPPRGRAASRDGAAP